MSFQVLRIETYKKTSLRGLGGETERDGREKAPHKNVDIVKSLSYKNMFLKKSSQGFHKEWQHIMDELHVQSRVNKKTNVLDGMVITSDKAFFEGLGWKKGRAPTPQMKEFFDEAYAWALKEIGFLGTDKNVISAVIHVDEETPHLHLYYLPVTEKWREKQYARGEDGNVLRNGKNPVYLRGENGEIIYAEKTDAEKPRLNRDEFWRVRGGVDSYALMQDRFFAEVARKWGLERGEKGSKKKHTTKQEHEKAEIIKARARVNVSVRKQLLGRDLLISPEDYVVLKDQALMYANRVNDLMSLDNRLDSVRVRELEVQRREGEVEEWKEIYEDKLQHLEDLPEKFKHALAQIKDLKGNVSYWRKLALASLDLDMPMPKSEKARSDAELDRVRAELDKVRAELDKVRAELDRVRAELDRDRAEYELRIKDLTNAADARLQDAVDESKRNMQRSYDRDHQSLMALLSDVASILLYFRAHCDGYFKAVCDAGLSAAADVLGDNMPSGLDDNLARRAINLMSDYNRSR